MDGRYPRDLGSPRGITWKLRSPDHGIRSRFPIRHPSPRSFLKISTFLVIEKPGLVPTHPLSPFETGTLANALVSNWPQTIGVGNKPLEPGLVHRLDSGTSGLLVAALEQGVWVQLKKDLAS